MITHEEIEKLAHLARIDVTPDEVAEYAKDFESILGYIDQINTADISSIETVQLQVNTTRNDESAHAPGSYVEKLLADAPDIQDGYYKMPKIL
jgi:aspartyl-tRNA(Asn)/glutamyl-tRNA(Gln) amidotransferase subunit C